MPVLQGQGHNKYAQLQTIRLPPEQLVAALNEHVGLLMSSFCKP